jgi:RNA polymerase sigma-70 factor, ECF subfamily
MIADILSGDHELFHELIRPHERSVYLMALSMLHNEAEAEDAAQDAFLKAYRNLGRFRGEARFSTWLISIVLNEARGPDCVAFNLGLPIRWTMTAKVRSSLCN